MLIITFLQRLCPDSKYLTGHTCCLKTLAQTYKKPLVLRFANQLNLLHLQNVSGGVKMSICSAGLSWSVTLLSFYFCPLEIVSLFLGLTRFISSSWPGENISKYFTSFVTFSPGSKKTKNDWKYFALPPAISPSPPFSIRIFRFDQSPIYKS